MCDLCQKEHRREWLWEDEICWITYCSTHGQPMIVLNRHAPQPTQEEMRHIIEIKEKLFPNLRFRGYMASNPEHWHEHLI